MTIAAGGMGSDPAFMPAPLCCSSGLLGEDAIGLLQQFYQMQNPNAPTPRQKGHQHKC